LLGVGCIGHAFEARRTIGTLYMNEFMSKANYVKGIDILKHDVEHARRLGFEVEVGDPGTFVDSEKYDVVLAGELLEHLSIRARFCVAPIKTSTTTAFSSSRLRIRFHSASCCVACCAARTNRLSMMNTPAISRPRLWSNWRPAGFQSRSSLLLRLR
jgi:hypothetical protein